jgi:hypothetical protein
MVYIHNISIKHISVSKTFPFILHTQMGRGGEGCINVYSTFIIRSLFHPYLGGLLNRFIVSSPNFYPTLDDNFTIELPLIISVLTLPMPFMQPTILRPIQFLTLYLCDELHICHNLNEQFTIKTTTHVKKFETQ